MTEQSPRRLERSSSDRMLSGVCGGLGEYFSVDPLILRIAFAVSVFFGGLGVVLYLALALLVPVDDSPDGKPLIAMSRSQGITIAIAIGVLVIAIPVFGVLFAWVGDPGVLWLLAVVILVAAGVTAWRDRERREAPAAADASEASAAEARTAEMPAGGEGAARPAASGSSHSRSPLVTVLLVCGIGLLSIAAFFAAALTVGFGLGALVAATIVAGGMATVALAFASGSAARWLIAPLAALVLGVGVAEAADLDLEGGVGQESHRPTSAVAIPADGYRLGMGNLSVDLRGMRWPDGEPVPLRADAGVGYVEVLVPPGVCVVGRATSRAGYVAIVGREDYGFDSVAESSSLRPGRGRGDASGSRARGGSRAGATGRGGVPGPASGRRPEPSHAPVLKVDASVDFGAVQVLNDGSASERDEHRGRISAASLAEMRSLNERACSR